MVEFAFVAPLGFLLLLGIIVSGIVITNQISLNNAVRDAARGAAVCGSAAASSSSSPVNTLPDGTTCSDANILTYVDTQLHSKNSGFTLSALQVYKSNGTAIGNPNETDACQNVPGSAYYVQVSVTYAQPLFLPLVGRVLGDPGSTTTRTLTAKAQATCEQ